MLLVSQGHLEEKKYSCECFWYWFQKYEFYFSEATLFDELAEDEGIGSSRPWGLPLPGWKDLHVYKPKADENASASSSPFKGSLMRREVVSRREALSENQVGGWRSSLCLMTVCGPDLPMIRVLAT